MTNENGGMTCMFMFITFFGRARKIYHRMDKLEDKAIVMAGIGAVASVLLASIMQPSLWYPPAVPCLATVLGLVEAVGYIRDRELKQERALGSVAESASRRNRLGLVSPQAASLAGRPIAVRGSLQSGQVRLRKST